jgi:diguanylate cyclase (GGDEF)-like protein
VMPGANPVDATAAAERLRISVEEISFAPRAGLCHKLSVSVGVSCSSDEVCNPDLLLQTADLALYEAKRQGRNRVAVAK